MKVEDKIDILQKEMKPKEYCDKCKQEMTKYSIAKYRVIVYVETPSSIGPLDVLQYTICHECKQGLELFLEGYLLA